MTFKELFQTGQCSINAIDAWNEIWHKRADMGQSLQSFLGLTDAEYQAWLMQGNAGLVQLLYSGRMPEYDAVYLGWDRLHCRAAQAGLLLLGYDARNLSQNGRDPQ